MPTVLPCSKALAFSLVMIAPAMAFLFAVPEASGQSIGIIYGTVFDPSGMKPLDGAFIVLEGNSSFWVSDNMGHYQITDLEYGEYNISAYKEGYAPLWKNITLSSQTLQVDFILRTAQVSSYALVRGSVALEHPTEDHPASDSAILVEPIGTAGPKSMIFDVWGQGTEGAYWMVLPAGNYSLTVWAYSHIPDTVGPLLLVEGSVTELDFFLYWTGMLDTGIAGNVTVKGNGAIPDEVWVVAYNEDTGAVYTVETDGNGFYFLTGPVPGNYSLAALCGGFDPVLGATVAVYGDITYLDLELEPDGPGPVQNAAIWGFLRGNGAKLLNGWVFTEDGSVADSALLGIPGLYAVMGLPSGEEHTVSAWAPGFHPVQHPVMLNEGGMTRHDLDLQGGGDRKEAMVEVKVVGDEASHLPITGAKVTVARKSPVTGEITYSRTIEMPDGASSCFFYPIPSADGYTVECTSAGYSFTGYDYAPGPLHKTPSDRFNILAGNINSITLYMNMSTNGPAASSALWGFVLDGSLTGVPVDGAYLPVHPHTGPYLYSSEIGRYEYNLTPGSSYLEAIYPGASNIMSYDWTTGAWGAGLWAGTLEPGETRHVDIVMELIGKDASAIAGQVRLRSTGEPLRDFTVWASSIGQSFPRWTTEGSGLFHFSPIKDLVGDWTVLGGNPEYEVVRVDYKALPDGTPTTVLDFPVTLSIPLHSVVWMDVFVNRTGRTGNNSLLWGYVYHETLGGEPISGALFPLSPFDDSYVRSSEEGTFAYQLAPGSYIMHSVHPGGHSVLSFDRTTGAWGVGIWTGTLAAGEVRQVDFVMKLGKGNASAIAGRVLTYSGWDGIDGFTLKAYTGSRIFPAQESWGGGFFLFSPIEDFSLEWTIDGEDPDYRISRVEYRVLPAGRTNFGPALPLSTTVPTSSVLWVDIFVNRTTIRSGRISGAVTRIYSNTPAAGADIRVLSGLDPSKPLRNDKLGEDGAFGFDLPPGNYQVDVRLPGYASQSVVLTLAPGGFIYHHFYLQPEATGSGNLTKLAFIYTDRNEPVRDMKVNVPGIGSFTTDQNGEITVRLYIEENYTVAPSGTIVGVLDGEGNNLTFNPDGTIRLVPGRGYTFRMKPYVLSRTVKGDGGIDIPTIALIAGIVLALIIGVLIGYISRRRPEEALEFEE